tara:strand:+ start:807 stop:998 length:192 start_codon:yes stop_codon:yes gene_type:complete
VRSGEASVYAGLPVLCATCAWIMSNRVRKSAGGGVVVAWWWTCGGGLDDLACEWLPKVGSAEK